MLRNKLIIAITFLLLLQSAIVFAGFVAPYDPALQNRDLPFAPPTRIHFVDARGQWHLRPFIYRWAALPQSIYEYQESRQREYPIYFFVRVNEPANTGVRTQLHLFGIEAPAQIFLAGSDNYGRDQFSRILYGGRISLGAGLLATGISLLLGLLLGAVSGFHGKWVDEPVMRLAELFLVLPWLYLLLAVRAFLPLHISPAQTFFLLLSVTGTLGRARPARVIARAKLRARSANSNLASRRYLA